ncbi:MAG: 2-phospho-L-lactate guanylyltransferase [Candidatus Hodarchaeaceae archaeon]|nr:2-phospho-L-lactate guanylyltransferase [Candidatus Hodarchaeaceae archaeon]
MDMSMWAIVPAKRLSEAKSSLSGVLTDDQRREIALRMLADVLEAVRCAPSAAGIIVVSPDEEVLSFAKENGALGFLEPGVGLNEAIKLAILHALSKGATSVLIIPSDLPLLSHSDVENIVAMASSPQDIVLAPSKDNGTNAMFLRPPNVMEPRFGGESFPVHLMEARKAGIRPRIYRSRAVAFDVDDVADLLGVKVHELGARTHDFLIRRQLNQSKSTKI